MMPASGGDAGATAATCARICERMGGPLPAGSGVQLSHVVGSGARRDIAKGRASGRVFELRLHNLVGLCRSAEGAEDAAPAGRTLNRRRRRGVEKLLRPTGQADEE